MRFQGKVAVITGGGSGIGAAARFATEGARVILSGRREALPALISSLSVRFSPKRKLFRALPLAPDPVRARVILD
jgi:NAD(P)-dependent dehydrogenase (short-subunit alcohol dehydrogenase family)